MLVAILKFKRREEIVEYTICFHRLFITIFNIRNAAFFFLKCFCTSLARYSFLEMADLDESAQDSLLDAALHATKDDDAVLGDISGVDPAVDDSLEDPVTMHFKF